MAQADVGQPVYLTVQEAASELRVSRTTIWRWIAEGRLAAYRAGGRTVRIRREDLRAALAPVQSAMEKEQKQMKDRVDVRVAEGDIWASYDPSRVKAALRRSAGALATVDRRALLKDIRRQRSQDSKGRPA
jgi:excisionase family DNA binding protein